MPGSVLYIPKTGSGVEAKGDEGVAEVVGVEGVCLVGHRCPSQSPQRPPGFRAVPATP